MRQDFISSITTAFLRLSTIEKKLALLAVIREQIASKKMQYILTLIDSDMPRDPDGDKINFSEDEIVLRLHDEGNEGRLFKMAEF